MAPDSSPEYASKDRSPEAVFHAMRKIVYDSWIEAMGVGNIYDLILRYREMLADIQSSVQPKGHRDIVTNLDIKLNEFLIERIRARLPDLSIETEEPYFDGGTNRVFEGTSQDRLIIDPLDGTTNAAFLQSHFSTAVALVGADRKPKMSLIFNPFTREFFEAHPEVGARCGGIPISVNTNSGGIVLLSDGSSDREKGMRLITLAHERGLEWRVLGSAQLDMCYVASGRAIGYMKTDAPDWDSLAGSFLVESAGGKATLEGGNVVVSNSHPAVHDKLLEIMRAI